MLLYPGIAIFCMLLTYYMWIKAVKTGSVYWSSVCALAYFYMVRRTQISNVLYWINSGCKVVLIRFLCVSRSLPGVATCSWSTSSPSTSWFWCSQVDSPTGSTWLTAPCTASAPSSPCRSLLLVSRYGENVLWSTLLSSHRASFTDMCIEKFLLKAQNKLASQIAVGLDTCAPFCCPPHMSPSLFLLIFLWTEKYLRLFQEYKPIQERKYWRNVPRLWSQIGGNFVSMKPSVTISVFFLWTSRCSHRSTWRPLVCLACARFTPLWTTCAANSIASSLRCCSRASSPWWASSCCPWALFSCWPVSRLTRCSSSSFLPLCWTVIKVTFDLDPDR